MDSASPYQPPLPPPMPPPGSFVPQSVKVFGIMHLILAGFGFLSLLGYVVTLLIGPLFISQKDPAFQAQLQFQAETRWINLMGAMFSVTLAGLLLTAGIKLVKSLPEGVKWSARYSWTSISTKIILLPVGLIWVMPATRRLMHETFKAQGGVGRPGTQAIEPMMDIVTTATSVVSPIICCLYPALALYFLSRPAVKAWCAAVSSRPGVF